VEIRNLGREEGVTMLTPQGKSNLASKKRHEILIYLYKCN